MRFIRKKKKKVLHEEGNLTKGLIISCFDYCTSEMKQRLLDFFDGRKKSISFVFKDGHIVIIEREE